MIDQAEITHISVKISAGIVIVIENDTIVVVVDEFAALEGRELLVPELPSYSYTKYLNIWWRRKS